MSMDKLFELSILEVSTNYLMVLEVQGSDSIDFILDMLKTNEFFSTGILKKDFSEGAEIGFIYYNNTKYILEVQSTSNSTQIIWAIYFREDIEGFVHSDAARRKSSLGGNLSLSTVTSIRKKAQASRAAKSSCDNLVSSRNRSQAAHLNLSVLPDYAKASPEGLIKAIRLASHHSVQGAPIDAEYTRQRPHGSYAMKTPQEISLASLKQRIKLHRGRESDHVKPPLSKALGLDVDSSSSVASLLAPDENSVKQACLKEYRTKGYPKVDNPLRSAWENKFTNLPQYFSSKREIQRAINLIRRQVNISYDDAFCSLAYCDGSSADALSRLVESNTLRNDINAIARIFPIDSIIDNVIESYSNPQHAEKLDELSQMQRRHHRKNAPLGVATISDRKPAKLLPLYHSVPIVSPSKVEDISAVSPSVKSISKFRRFNQEIDKRIEMSSTLEAMSRSDAIKNDDFKLWKQIQSEKRRTKQFKERLIL